MDFILMGEFALCRINISKAGQDFGRRWHNDLAAVGLAPRGAVGTGGESQTMNLGGICSALVTFLVLPTGLGTGC